MQKSSEREHYHAPTTAAFQLLTEGMLCGSVDPDSLSKELGTEILDENQGVW